MRPSDRLEPAAHVTSRDEVHRLLEMERAQWGHDLHDDLLPLLFAARAGAERLHHREQHPHAAADGEATSDRAAALEQIVAWIEQAMVCGRRMLGHLQPLDSQQQTWQEATTTRIETLFGDRVALQWNLQPSLVELPAALATAAYRIVVEATRNAVQHGKATRVTIDAVREGQQGRIVISDNGRGFDPSHVVGDHYGLQIMKSRAELAGGWLRVESQPGGPTSVTFSFAVSGV